MAPRAGGPGAARQARGPRPGGPRPGGPPAPRPVASAAGIRTQQPRRPAARCCSARGPGRGRPRPRRRAGAAGLGALPGRACFPCRSRLRARPSRPRGPECSRPALIALMRRPFGWLVVAEPTDLLAAETAGLRTELEILRRHTERRATGAVEQNERRLAERGTFGAAGLWRSRSWPARPARASSTSWPRCWRARPSWARTRTGCANTTGAHSLRRPWPPGTTTRRRRPGSVLLHRGHAHRAGRPAPGQPARPGAGPPARRCPGERPGRR